MRPIVMMLIPLVIMITIGGIFNSFTPSMVSAQNNSHVCSQFLQECQQSGVVWSGCASLGGIDQNCNISSLNVLSVLNLESPFSQLIVNHSIIGFLTALFSGQAVSNASTSLPQGLSKNITNPNTGRASNIVTFKDCQIQDGIQNFFQCPALETDSPYIQSLPNSSATNNVNLDMKYSYTGQGYSNTWTGVISWYAFGYIGNSFTGACIPFAQSGQAIIAQVENSTGTFYNIQCQVQFPTNVGVLVGVISCSQVATIQTCNPQTGTTANGAPTTGGNYFFTFLGLIGAVLFLFLALGLTVGGGALTVNFQGGVNPQGSRLALAFGIGLLMWTFVASEFGSWTGFLGFGLSLMVNILLGTIYFLGVYWQSLSYQ